MEIEYLRRHLDNWLISQGHVLTEQQKNKMIDIWYDASDMIQQGGWPSVYEKFLFETKNN